MKISIIGFGKLGSSTGFFLSSKKNEIYAYDINKKIIDGFKKKKPLFFEKSTENYIKNNNIKFCNDVEEAINKTTLSYLVLPTPSLKNNKFDASYILNVLDLIIPEIKKKKTKHTLVITSTVSPGTCNEIVNYIYKKFKFKDTIDYRLIYNPYFIALGSIIGDLDQPDLLLIGSDYKNISFYKNYLKKIYKKKIKKIKLNFLNFKEAEISKLAINCYVTMKISFSNSLSQLADVKKNKINTVKILNAVGSDSRIGKKYLSLGPMFSGPCFPRDNLAMSSYFKDLGLTGDLFQSTHKINILQNERYLNILKKINKFQNKKIGFLGLTYKSGTDLFTDSPAFYIMNKIKPTKKNKITGYDPYFSVKTKSHIMKKHKLLIFDSLNSFIKNTDIIFLSYRDNKFLKAINFENKTFIDPWNFFKEDLTNSKIIYPGISDR